MGIKLLVVFFVICSINLYAQNNKLSGKYLGMTPPEDIPEIFAPGVVSTDKNEHSAAIFSKDGNELFWSYYDNGEHVIMYMQQIEGIWSQPSKFNNVFSQYDGNPFFSADWNELYFHSQKKIKGKQKFDFWCVKKNKKGWSEEFLLEFLPDFDKWKMYGCQSENKNIYFTSKENEESKEFQIYVSKYQQEKWCDAQLLKGEINKSPINWTPFVCKNESYIIFSSDREDADNQFDGCDLYISFNEGNDNWSKPINMGNKINTDEIERFPWVSPDGKYLFFVRGFGDVYWVSAEIINELKTANYVLDK